MKNHFVIKVALVVAGVLVLAAGGYFAIAALTGGNNSQSSGSQQYAQAQAAAASSVAPAAGAAQGAGSVASGAVWAERCNKDFKAGGPRKGTCEIFQRLVVKDGNKRLIETAIGFPKDKDFARGIFIVPLGINLESGIVLLPDGGKPFKIQIRYCAAEGCYAFADLTPAVLDVLKASRTLTVTFQAVNGRAVKVDMTLEGFGPALDRIAT